MSVGHDIQTENIEKDVCEHKNKDGQPVKSFYINGNIHSEHTFDSLGNVINDITYDQDGKFFSHTCMSYVPKTKRVASKISYDKEDRAIERVDYHYGDVAPFLLKKKEHFDSLDTKVKTTSYQYKKFGDTHHRSEKSERTHDTLTVSKYVYNTSKKDTVIAEETKTSLDKKIIKQHKVYDPKTGYVAKEERYDRGKKVTSIAYFKEYKLQKEYGHDGQVACDLLFARDREKEGPPSLQQKRTFLEDGSLSEIRDYYSVEGVRNTKQTIFKENGNVEFFNLSYNGRGIESRVRIKPSKKLSLPEIKKADNTEDMRLGKPDIFLNSDGSLSMSTFWIESAKIDNYYMYDKTKDGENVLRSIDQRNEDGTILKVECNQGMFKNILPIQKIILCDLEAKTETSCPSLMFGSNAETLLQMLKKPDVLAVGATEQVIKQNIQDYKAKLQ